MHKCTPIYKNTTIDPKGNIAFCKSQGCRVISPSKVKYKKDGTATIERYNFFSMMEKYGYPSMFYRWCCSLFKEYKCKDYVIIGVRKDESKKRTNRYKEPEECRVFNGKKANKKRTNVARQYYPILEWTNQDVYDYLEDRKTPVNSLYTDNYGGGYLDTARRLGCICCPLKSKKSQREDFKNNPTFLKLDIKHGMIWLENERKKGGKSAKIFDNVYEKFFYHLWCDSKQDFYHKVGKGGLFPQMDCKKFL